MSNRKLMLVAAGLPVVTILITFVTTPLILGVAELIRRGIVS